MKPNTGKVLDQMRLIQDVENTYFSSFSMYIFNDNQLGKMSIPLSSAGRVFMNGLTFEN
jgi:hypothetical protein